MVDHVFDLFRDKSMTIKSLFVLSPISMQDYLEVIMCSSKAICLPLDCCFNELSIRATKFKVSVTYNTSSLYKNVPCSRHDITENVLTLYYTIQQPLLSLNQPDVFHINIL